MFILRKNKGFTLIEMMVTVSIFAFMTALVVAKYGTFNQGALLTNMAYDIALAVRTAQTYGVSVRAKVDTSDYNNVYGVIFSKSPNETCSGTTPASASKFSLYSFPYSPTGTQDYRSSLCSLFDNYATYSLKRGSKITKIYKDSTRSAEVIGNEITVVFKRPDPSAIITDSVGKLYTYVMLEIVDSQNTSKRYVEIRQNGQISIKQQ